jgi:hypothetical protein
VLAGGALRLYREVPKTLEPLRLAGRAAPVDLTLLARLAANPGPDWLASLVQAALNARAVALVGGPPAEHLIAGLINCLPPECRTEFSFSTGLKFSSRRPFRLIALAEDLEERLRVQRLYSVAVLDLSGPRPPECRPVDSWPRLIQRVLKSGRASLLSTQFSRRQSEFMPEDLPALGLQLLEELDASSFSGDASEEQAWPEGVAEDVPHDVPDRLPHEDPHELLDDVPHEFLDELPDEVPHEVPDEVPHEHPAGMEGFAPGPRGCPEPLPSGDPSPEAAPSSELFQQAHEAHPRFRQPSPPPVTAQQKRPAPSKLLDPDDPEVLEKLERLDDLVYEAIAGKPAAMDRLKTFWPQVRHELDAELLAESQEQYLRYALSIWEECVQSDTVRDPARAVQSLEVLCMLFDEL